MSSKYPVAIDGYAELPYIVDLVSPVDSAAINSLRTAIVNIESELGIQPSGVYIDLATRLDNISFSGGGGVSTNNLQDAYELGNTILLSDSIGDLIITVGNAGSISDFVINDGSENYILVDSSGSSLDLGSTNNIVDFVGSAGVTSTGNGPWNFGTGQSTFGGVVNVGGATIFNNDATFNTFCTADATEFPESAADPTNEANTGFIYTKDDGGDTELFYIDDGGTVTQITKDGVINVTEVSGFIIMNAAENIAAGDAVYITTSGTLGIADNATSGKTEVAGFSATAVTAGNPVTLQSLQGSLITVKTDISGSTEGDIVYLGTSGNVTTTIPYNQHIFRVGRVINAGTVAGDGQIEFSPQNFMQLNSNEWAGSVYAQPRRAEDDNFDDGSLDAKWTTWNPSSKHSVSEVLGLGLKITATSTATADWGGVIQALPAVNQFIVTAKIGLGGKGIGAGLFAAGGAGSQAGLVVGEDLITNPTTASFYEVGFYISTGGIFVSGFRSTIQGFSNYNTAFGGSAFFQSPIKHIGYFRIYVDKLAGGAGECYPLISANGLDWINLNFTMILGGVVSVAEYGGIAASNLNNGADVYGIGQMFRVDITSNMYLPVGSW